MSATLLYLIFAHMNLDQLKPFIDWLQANPGLAGLATFLISVAESLAIVGLLIPGTIVMSAIGVLVGTNVLPAPLIIGCAILGAIVGDGLSYWLGHHFHEHIRDIWPFKRYPKLMEKGAAYFTRYGGMSVFMGRFVGPIRPIIPVVAGMMNMLPSRFLIANVTSAIAWAIAYMAPGILIGNLSLQLAPRTATRFLMMLIIFALILWLVFFLLRRLARVLIRYLDQRYNRMWQIILHRPKWHRLKVLLQDATFPTSYRPLVLFTIACILFLFLIALSFNVAQEGLLTSLNSPMLNLFRTLRIDPLDNYMVILSFLGSLPVLLGFYFTVLVTFIFKKWRHAAAHWLSVGALSFGGTALIKFLIQVPSPLGLTFTHSYSSFPSAEIAISIALYLTFFLWLTHHKPRFRWAFILPVSVILTAIIISRLYLGVEWFTDIIAGIVFGTLCALVCTLAYQRTAKELLTSTLLIALASFAIIISFSSYTLLHYQEKRHDYAISWPVSTLDAKAWWTLQVQLKQMYRQNQFGKSEELFNIQWADMLFKIEQSLLKQGWETVPKTNIAIFINRVAAKDIENKLPVFPMLYLGRKPVLMMTKSVKDPNRLLVLRLWDAKLTLNNGQVPLWVGIVSYHRQRAFLPSILPRKQKVDTTQIVSEPVLKTFEKDLPKFEWKEVFHPSARCLADDTDCNGSVLLIRSNKKHR